MQHRLGHWVSDHEALRIGSLWNEVDRERLAGYRHIGTGTFRATPRMQELLDQVLNSGRISYGPMSKAFERKFAGIHGCKYGILSNSGTSSLHVALQALKILNDWPDGVGVLVPAITFVATVNIILHNNLRPVFVDVESTSYGMDPDDAAIMMMKEQDVVAAIPVHLFGQSCNMRRLLPLFREHGLKIIEDSCETMFATHHGAYVGQMGDVACFSLYNAHIITAGVGGVATTNNPKIARVMRSLVNHGLALEELNVDDETFSPMPAIGRSFRFAYPGHSYRITEMEAALALAQLEQRDHIVDVRRRNAKHLTARFNLLNKKHGPTFLVPKVAPGNTHSWMMFALEIDEHSPIEKHDLTRYLNRHGIETRDMMPITNQPIFRDMVDPLAFPVAERINRQGYYVGVHQDLTPEDIEYVAHVHEEYLIAKGD